MAQTIIVDISTRGANPVAYTHQNDTGRTFFAEIYENGEAFAVAGYTIKVGAILPSVDGGYRVIAGTDMVTATKTSEGTNQIYFTLTSEYSSKAGNGILTLIFTSNTGTPTTIRPINIDFRIQESADGADVIAGASDFPATLDAIVDNWLDENGADNLAEWFDSAITAEDLQDYINAWLDDHPEATTTVEDESLSINKLIPGTLGYYTPEMFGAVGDGETDDKNAFIALLSANKNVYIPNKTYFISSTLLGESCNVIKDEGIYNAFRPIYPNKNKINGFYDFGLAKAFNIDRQTYIECCCYNTKTNKIIWGVRDYSTSPNKSILMIVNPETFAIENTYSYDMAIINAMSYNAKTNKILACCFDGGTPTHAQNMGVNIIDGDTMQREGILTTPDGHPFYIYNNDANVYVEAIHTGGLDVDYTYKIYDDNMNLLRTVILESDDNAQQDYHSEGSKIYQLSWQSIIEYDFITGEKNRIEAGSISELEGVTTIGDKLVITAHVLGEDGSEFVFLMDKNNRRSYSYTNMQDKVVPVENYRLSSLYAEGCYKVTLDNNISYSDAAITYDFPSGLKSGIVINHTLSNAVIDPIVIAQTIVGDTVPGGFTPVFVRNNVNKTWTQWTQLACTVPFLRENNTASCRVKTIAENLPRGVYHFQLSPASDVSELPGDGNVWKYASGTIVVRGSKLESTGAFDCRITLRGWHSTTDALCVWLGSSWGNWLIDYHS